MLPSLISSLKKLNAHHIVLLVLAMEMLLPDAAFAGTFRPGSIPSTSFSTLPTDAATGNNAIEQVMCNLIIIMTGTTGKAIATVGIVGIGVGALFGKVSWNAAMLATLSVGLIFGAASIVGELGGGPGFALIIGSPSLSGGGVPTSGTGEEFSGGEAPGSSSSNTCSAGTLIDK